MPARGAVANTRRGIIMPDIELNFVIPENPVFTYSEEPGELTVFDTGGAPHQVEMPKNDGKTAFPVIVKDREGNLYKVEEKPGEDISGEPFSPGETGVDRPLTATYMGRQGDPLPKRDYSQGTLS
jgi:hypothetical protein